GKTDAQRAIAERMGREAVMVRPPAGAQNNEAMRWQSSGSRRARKSAAEGRFGWMVPLSKGARCTVRSIISIPEFLRLRLRVRKTSRQDGRTAACDALRREIAPCCPSTLSFAAGTDQVLC